MSTFRWRLTTATTTYFSTANYEYIERCCYQHIPLLVTDDSGAALYLNPAAIITIRKEV